jgi:phage shock protein C
MTTPSELDTDLGTDPAVPDGGSTSTPPEPPPAVRPPLRRSTEDKVIAGVAGGLGRYLAVDPVLIRVALVIFALSGGAGVLLYIIAWIAIPEERPGEVPAVAAHPGRNNGAIVLGAILLIAGGLLFADRLMPSLSTYIGPLVLLALGAALVLGSRR